MAGGFDFKADMLVGSHWMGVAFEYEHYGLHVYISRVNSVSFSSRQQFFGRIWATFVSTMYDGVCY